MRFSKILLTVTFLVVLSFSSEYVRGTPVNNSRAPVIRSDVIVTSWPQNTQESSKAVPDNSDERQPGFLRRQLMKFGDVMSRVGNAMGSHATKITSAVEKVCEIVRTIIPLLAAVCHVGQFKFCGATADAPGELQAALSPTYSLNLDEPDR